MAVLAAVAVTVASGSIGILIHQSTKSRQLFFGRISAESGVVLEQRQGTTSNGFLRAALTNSRTLISGVAQALSSMR